MGGASVELIVPPPSIDDHLTRADDCLRALNEKWDVIWKSITDLSIAEIIRTGLYPACGHDWDGAFKLAGISVDLNFEREMVFWLTVTADGQLSEDDVMEVLVDAAGIVRFVELKSLL